MTQALLPCHPFSDGELAFFRRFIRHPSTGSNGMLDCAIERWGFCQRHTLGLLAVCASIPRAGLNTAGLLYQRTIQNAITVLRRCASTDVSYSHSICGEEPCPMCELGLNEHSTGLVRREWLTLPHSLERLQWLLNDTFERWSPFVCSTCVSSAAGPLCRTHADAAMLAGGAPFDESALGQQLVALEALDRQLLAYLETFLPESAGVDTGEGVAALIAAAGWCGGWKMMSLAAGYRLVGGTAHGA
jgi:hypothetical protein